MFSFLWTKRISNKEQKDNLVLSLGENLSRENRERDGKG